MKPRSILTIGLMAVVALSACAPAATTATVQTEAPLPMAPEETEPPASPSSMPTELPPEQAPTDILPTEVPADTPQVVATSRGPDLEATDPSLYTRASGGVQLVEFFAFW